MPRKTAASEQDAVLASNRSAAHEYHLLERFEAGLVLLGPEVKSARAGRVNLKEAWVRVRGGEAVLHDAHFSPYDPAARENVDPTRPRRLLLHAREIRKLERETEVAGATLVPIRMYLKGGRIKLEIALGRGKKLHDKRETLRRRELEQEARRAGAGDRGA